MKQIQKTVSNKISNMNFILAFFIVLIHSSCLGSLNAETSFYSINYVIQKSILIIADTAVPLFFMMSMFLLFSGYEIKNYGSLIKKKTKSVLLPFLVWGIFGWIFYATLTHIPMLSNLVQVETVSFSPLEIMRSLLFAKYNSPIWFLRSLFVLILISPVIYLMVKKLNKILFGLLLLAITLFLAFFNINYSYAIFWLPVCIIAARFGYYKSKEYKEPSKILSVISLILLLVFVALIILFDIEEQSTIYYLYRMISPLLLWITMDLFSNINKRHLNEKLNFSFFSFCAHIYFVIIFKKIFIALLGKSNFGITLVFFATGVVSFTACFAISLLLKKFAPKFYSFICGGRLITKRNQ